MDTQTLVTFDHVTKTFNLGHERSNVRAAIPGRWGEPRGRQAFRALDDVSFTVQAGEAFAIIGPNGAGKSTLLKILAGAVAPSSGRIVRPARCVSIIELGLGFDPDLTGEENIGFGGALLGMTPDQIEAHREEIIEFAGIANFATMPVKRYSTGMLARLGFALATSVEADLFIIDEVLSVGDWEFQRRSFERIRERHTAGAAVIFVSHNLWVVNQLCQRAVLLEAGRVAALGPTPGVLAAYLGDTQYTLHHGGVTQTDTQSVAPRPLGDERAAHPARDGDADGPADALASGEDATPETGAGSWRPVVIRELVMEPDTIEPGDPVVLRAEIDVRVPLPDHRLVASMFWEGYATFAIPDELPSEFLQVRGTHLVEVRYDSVPVSPSVTTWQLAVVPTGETDEDPEQALPGAIERASATLTTTGGFTPRPGIFLAHSVSVTPAPPAGGSAADETTADPVQQGHGAAGA